MKTIDASTEKPIELGKQGEHLDLAVRFLMEDFLDDEDDGDGTFQLFVRRCGDDSPQPVLTSRDEEYLYWFPGRGDRAVPGIGSCELQYLKDSAVDKSKVYVTSVQPSLTGEEIDAPQPYESWMDYVIRSCRDAGVAADEAKQSEEVAQASMETAVSAKEDAEIALQGLLEALQHLNETDTVVVPLSNLELSRMLVGGDAG